MLFFKTFLIYLDNISPVLETYSHFKRNFLKKNVTCYWIVHNERRVGIIITKISDTYLQITDLAVLKKYQNSGVGKAALKEILINAAIFLIFAFSQLSRMSETATFMSPRDL